MHERLAGKEKERYVDRLFSSIADRYDLINSVISVGRHRSWRKTAVRMSGIAPGGTALDVATGTGDFAIELARAVGSSGRVVGVDFCGPMLEVAKRKTAGYPNIELVEANAEGLPFDADSFDCVTIGFALRNVQNVAGALLEMVRVARPGGRVVSLEILGPKTRVLQPLWRLYFSRLMPSVVRLFGVEREPYQYLPDSVRDFCSREELAEAMSDCGLVDVSVRDLMLGAVCIHMGVKI